MKSVSYRISYKNTNLDNNAARKIIHVTINYFTRSCRLLGCALTYYFYKKAKKCRRR